MKPRELCSEPSYEMAILTTFNFDPIFFEELVLPGLWESGVGEVLVMADRGQVEQRVSSWPGRLRHLGKSYLLDAASSAGLFHPKLILKLGKDGAHLLCGSGNLSSGGWGANYESCAHWKIASNHSDAARNVRALLESLRGYATSGRTRDFIARAEAYHWIEAQDDGPAVSPRCLLSPPFESLSATLARRWTGRRFDRLTITTGSTDEDGAFLRWCREQFGVSESTIVVTPGACQFDPRKLSKIPIRISLSPSSSSKLMHAKMYIFENDRECALVMGSANCSASAWLVPPSSGGNVEAVVIYDNVRRNVLDLLTSWTNERLRPSDVLKNPAPRPITHASDRSLQNVIEYVCWSRFSGHFIVSFVNEISAAASVTARLGEAFVTLRPDNGERRRWSGETADCFLGEFSEIAMIEIRHSERKIEAIPHWVEHLEELAHASHGKRMGAAIEALSSTNDYNERRKILGELLEIQRVLLDESDYFTDPPTRSIESQHTKRQSGPEDLRPVDPAELLRSMHDVQIDSEFTPRVGGSRHLVGLGGIIRALFEDSTPEADYDEDGAPHASSRNTSTPRVEKQPEEGDRAEEDRRLIRLKERLEDQMEEFLEKLRSSEFISRCTATQLIQAAAFPVVIAISGINKNWFSQEKGGEWVSTVSDILFTMDAEDDHGDSFDGLLDLVRHRYEQSGRGADFRRITGDGVLWIVLLAGAGCSSVADEWGCLQRAMLVRSILRRSELVALSNKERLATLVSSSRFQDMKGWFARHAIRVTQELDKTEKEMQLIADSGAPRGGRLKEEETVFHVSLGWGRFIGYDEERRVCAYMQARASEAQFNDASYFLSLRQAKGLRPSVSRHLEALQRCFTLAS